MRSFMGLLITVSLLLIPFAGCGDDASGPTEETEPAAAADMLDDEPTESAP